MFDEAALPSPTRIDIDGTEIASYRLGPDGDRSAGDILLCHGTPWSAATWMPVARLLAAERRVFLWDMPGYGSSIADGLPAADLVHQRRRLAALIDRWGLERPHVVAHDIGGAVALGAHLFEGSDFASLHLVDVVTLSPWGSPFFRLVAQHEEVFAALPSDLHTALVREYIAGATAADLDVSWLDELVRPWSSEAGQASFYRQIAQLDPSDTAPIAEHLHDVRCPVRIGWGSRDPWIPPGQAAELAAHLPSPTDVVMFPEAGHLVPLEATGALAEDALRWIDSLT